MKFDDFKLQREGHEARRGAKNYEEAQTLTNRLPEGNYKRFLKIIIPILNSHRESKPTLQEVNILKEIANGENEASIDARHFLSFFLEILVVPKHTILKSNDVKTAANNPEIAKTFDKIKFKSYPNPTPGIINFEWDLETNQPVSLIITDINGKMISEIKNLEAQTKYIVNLNNLANGIYIYKIYTANTFVKTGKIVLSK